MEPRVGSYQQQKREAGSCWPSLRAEWEQEALLSHVCGGGWSFIGCRNRVMLAKKDSPVAKANRKRPLTQDPKVLGPGLGSLKEQEE